MRLRTLYHGFRSKNEIPWNDSRESGRSWVAERNAWAFTLAVVRKYRELGVDIAPNYTDRKLIAIANKTLQSYRASKVKPSFMDYQGVTDPFDTEGNKNK